MSVCSHEMAEFFCFHTIHTDTGTWIGIMKYRELDIKHVSTGLKSSDLNQICLAQNVSLFSSCSVSCVK